jgi:two-component system sensor histidine kinase BaeS
MLRSLRQRLILSHLLPVLVIVPVMGIALIYVLETGILLPEIAKELSGQAELMVRLAGQEPELWQKPVRAQAFVDELSRGLPARIMLLDGRGQLLASSDPGDMARVGQRLAELPALSQALAGEPTARTEYSRDLHAEIADVLMPVQGRDQQVVGVIRLSHRLVTVQEQFIQLRYLIVSVLVVGLVLGMLVGLLLALNMERPIRRVTLAIYGVSRGDWAGRLREQGPEEIRLLLRAVNNLVSKLRSLEQARRQLLANLVHELGRPLGAVHSAVRALMGRSGGDAAIRQELLEGIEQEILRLGRLLDDLAELHDQVLGRLELDRRAVELSGWLEQMLAPWREAAGSKGLSWQAEVPAGLPTVEIDPDRLGQAIGNLISNAIKYTPAQGRVTIRAGQEDETVWIGVSDTGRGIPLAEQAEVFRPLYRGQSGDRFPQGMGLGLSIAHELVVAHGGRIEVVSEPGQGSEFTIWLPLAP